jgi:hypothetical protein
MSTACKTKFDPLEIRLHFRPWRKLWCCARPAGRKQHATGMLHLILRISSGNKKSHTKWCGISYW